jgi:hypothetical protein
MQPDGNYQNAARRGKAQFGPRSIEKSPNFSTYPKHTLKTPALRPAKPGFHRQYPPGSPPIRAISARSINEVLGIENENLPPPYFSHWSKYAQRR